MNRQDTHKVIVNYLVQYQPERIGIFGSYARQEEDENSDIDILVKFRQTITLLDLSRIHRELAELIGRRVDLITESALKNKRLKDQVMQDLQIIFE